MDKNKTEFTVAIIGSGFGGQISAINLRKNNIDDFCILERKSYMGGTWVQNNYPGAAVDVHSPLYSLSSEPYPWTKMFAERDELEEYTNYIIDKHNLRERTILSFNVDQIRWISQENKWEITSGINQKVIKAKYIISGGGALSNPLIPKFEGINNFKGKMFHSSQWDTEYDLTNKKVAVIGNGASAAQIIPAISKKVAHLNVFQRNAHWVMPRPDMDFSKLQQKLLKNKFVYKFIREIIYWTLESRIFGFVYSSWLLDTFAKSKSLAHIKKQVKSEELRKKLEPKYSIGCKRIILSNTYLKTFNQDNVSLITENIKEFTQDGILTKDNKEIKLDLIVFATGFVVSDDLVPYKVIGEDNVLLKDYWGDFPRAYLGTSVSGFPNYFILTGPNTGIGHTSLIHIIESQMYYIINAINKSTAEKSNVQVTKKAETEYTAKVHEKMSSTIWVTGGCNSWYKSQKTGKVIALYPDFSFKFRLKAKKFINKHHIMNSVAT